MYSLASVRDFFIPMTIYYIIGFNSKLATMTKRLFLFGKVQKVAEWIHEWSNEDSRTNMAKVGMGWAECLNMLFKEWRTATSSVHNLNSSVFHPQLIKQRKKSYNFLMMLLLHSRCWKVASLSRLLRLCVTYARVTSHISPMKWLACEEGCSQAHPTAHGCSSYHSTTVFEASTHALKNKWYGMFFFPTGLCNGWLM